MIDDLDRNEATTVPVPESEQTPPNSGGEEVLAHPTAEHHPREPRVSDSTQACYAALLDAGLPNDRLYSWIRHPEIIARDLQQVASWSGAHLYCVDDLLVIDERITPKSGLAIDLLILVGGDYPFHPPSALLKEVENGTLHILDLSGRTPVPSIPDCHKIALEHLQQLVPQPQPTTTGDTTCHEIQSI